MLTSHFDQWQLPNLTFVDSSNELCPLPLLFPFFFFSGDTSDSTVLGNRHSNAFLDSLNIDGAISPPLRFSELQFPLDISTLPIMNSFTCLVPATSLNS